MNQYILDTDTCIYWLNGKEKIRQKVQQKGTDNLRITIVTFAELRYGAYKSQRVAENLTKIDDFIRKVRLLPLDQSAAEKFGKIKADLRSRGQIINDLDILIAAITLRYSGVLVTNNTAHFQRIDDLHYENWLAEPEENNGNR